MKVYRLYLVVLKAAKFAETTTIGNPSFEHVEITSVFKTKRRGSTVRLSMDSMECKLDQYQMVLLLNVTGDMTFNGAITILILVIYLGC